MRVPAGSPGCLRPVLLQMGVTLDGLGGTAIRVYRPREQNR